MAKSSGVSRLKRSKKQKKRKGKIRGIGGGKY